LDENETWLVFMEKSLSNTIGLGLFRRKGEEIDGHG
jgi:hypothetical protein